MGETHQVVETAAAEEEEARSTLEEELPQSCEEPSKLVLGSTLFGIDTQSCPQDAEPVPDKRLNIAKEIISTESTYQLALDLMINVGTSYILSFRQIIMPSSHCAVCD
jgi:hypothetical protein